MERVLAVVDIVKGRNGTILCDPRGRKNQAWNAYAEKLAEFQVSPKILRKLCEQATHKDNCPGALIANQRKWKQNTVIAIMNKKLDFLDNFCITSEKNRSLLSWTGF